MRRPRRGDRRRARRRRRDPDLGGAWTLLPARSRRASSVLRPRARLGVVRTGSRTSRDRYGSRYMLAFCRAEYGAVAPLARALVAGRARCSPPPSRTSRARARRGRPARWPGSPSCGGARAATPRPSELLRAGRRVVARRCCAARQARARPRPAARGGRARSSGVLRQVPGERRLERAPALDAAGPCPRARAAAWSAPEPRSPSCARCSRARRHGARCAPCADRAEGVLARRARRARGGPARCSRTPSTASRRAGAPYEARADAPRAGRRAARARPPRRGARREARAARAGCSRWERRRTPSARPAARRRPAARAHARASARSLAPARRWADEPAGSPSGSCVSEHTVHRHVTNLLAQARPALSRRGRRAACAGLVRTARTAMPRGAMARPGEVAAAGAPRSVARMATIRRDDRPHRRIWALGDYHRFATAARVEPRARARRRRAASGPGMRVLDVAAGHRQRRAPRRRGRRGRRRLRPDAGAASTAGRRAAGERGVPVEWVRGRRRRRSRSPTTSSTS